MRWSFEPGHTAPSSARRHMMVSIVRGHFKNIAGILIFDRSIRRPARSMSRSTRRRFGWRPGARRPPAKRRLSRCRTSSVHYLQGVRSSCRRPGEVKLTGALTIRGVTRRATLEVRSLGQWSTPWWEDGVDKGPKKRAGFLATTRINRHDSGWSWNDKLDRGGVVVSDEVDIIIDVEAILEER